MQTVKGFTRRIVEVRQVGSGLFDRAVFYCRTDLPRSVSEQTLAQEAQRIVTRLTHGPAELFPQAPPKKARRFRARGILKVMVSAAAGALGAVLLLRLL